ncbi:MAG: hypothetical protein O2854_09915 [Chloroflexi bacterium]|nr:hypothetical protein [Chloroflexota bacterium]
MAGLVNSELISMANSYLRKQAFVPGDQAAAGAGGGDPMAGGGAPPMDPSMGGGAPPMDPAMAGGGGAPPMGGGGDPLAMLQPMIQQAVQAAMASQGGGAGGAGGGGGIKPKIDVNVEMMQIKKMLAHIMDGLQIPMPASQMVATSDDLNAMAANPGEDPTAGGAPGGSAIAPIQPMQAAAPDMGGEKAGAFENGFAYKPTAADRLAANSTLASQLMGVTGRR